MTDHAAPGQEWRHGIEEFTASPEGTHAGGAEHLVRRQGKEVTAE